MRLSTRARYGTRVLVDLALHNGRRLSLGEVAARQQVSRSYLEHLIAPLVEAGIVGSVRGTGGGVWLARPAPQVKLNEVIRLLEGNCLLVECVSRPEVCSRAEGCVTRCMWGRVEQAIFTVLGSITLHDLAAEHGESTICQELLNPVDGTT